MITATKVSEPSGARLAPGKNALLVGCRGFASLQLTVRTFEDKVSWSGLDRTRRAEKESGVAWGVGVVEGFLFNTTL